MALVATLAFAGLLALGILHPLIHEHESEPCAIVLGLSVAIAHLPCAPLPVLSGSGVTVVVSPQLPAACYRPAPSQSRAPPAGGARA